MKILPKLVSVVLLSAAAVSSFSVLGYADSEVKYGFSNDSAILTVDGVNVSYLENEYYKAYADKFGSHFVKLAEKTDGAKISPEFRDKISKWETGYITVVFNSFTDEVQKKYENLITAPCKSVPASMLKIKPSDLEAILNDDNVKAVFPSFASAADDGSDRVTADEFSFNYAPSASDARKILRYTAKLDSAPENMSEGKKFFILSDTNLDMKITAKDARCALRISTKLETGKKYEKPHNALAFWEDKFDF